MRHQPVITLKSDSTAAWIAVLDPTSGARGRYTVYRVGRRSDKAAHIVGREIDLRTARKLVKKGEPAETDTKRPGLEHECAWREAAVKLARCVVMTIQTGGKIGVGSGLLFNRETRKTERWDKEFIEALAFIGLEVTDKPKRRRRGAAS